MAEIENNEEKCEYVHDPILDTEEMKKMFVGGIAPDTKDEELKEFFESIGNGKVTDHVVIRKDQMSEKKSVFGFVTFETSEMVDEVLLKRKDLNLNNRSLDVNRAVPKNNTSAGAHEKTKKLFIANLPKFDCSEQDLQQYFDARHKSKYGTIESIQLIKRKDEQGNKMEENKGFGFIMVSSEDMADKMAIQHATFEFGGRRIELKKSVPTVTEGGGRGRGGRGGGSHPMNAGPAGGTGGYSGGYGGYGGGYGDWYGYGNGYDYYYGAYPSRGGYRGGHADARGGQRGGGGRYAPY